MAERLALLISGGGTTMAEMIQATQTHPVLRRGMSVAAVITDNPNAGGIDKALSLGIPKEDIVLVDPANFMGEDGEIDSEGFGNALLSETKRRGVSVVTQNGWLSKTPPQFIDAYRDTIFNQHPGPKRETGGMKGVQPHAVMEEIVIRTGRNEGSHVTTHRVNNRWDDGATVGIEHVLIDNAGEDAKVLQARALPLEHLLQIKLLKQVVRGNVRELKLEPNYIQAGEEEMLKDIRKFVREQYPQG